MVLLVKMSRVPSTFGGFKPPCVGEIALKKAVRPQFGFYFVVRGGSHCKVCIPGPHYPHFGTSITSPAGMYGAWTLSN